MTPYAETRKMLAEIAAAINVLQNRRPLILVIDDQVSCYEILERWLVDCDTEWAETGEKGLALIEQNWRKYNCVICDERLPLMQGHEVLAVCRKRWPDLFTVLTSSYDWDVEIQQKVADLKLTVTLAKTGSGPDLEGVKMLLSFILGRSVAERV